MGNPRESVSIMMTVFISPILSSVVGFHHT